jgi:hypothetical protein
VIKNAVIYFTGRLPIVADLRALPAPSDMTILATNLRTRDGKRPTFADSSESWFIMPLRDVMAIELPRDSLELAEQVPSSDSEPIELGPPSQPPPPPSTTELPDASPLETDEDLLARIRQL